MKATTTSITAHKKRRNKKKHIIKHLLNRLSQNECVNFMCHVQNTTKNLFNHFLIHFDWFALV